MVGDFWDVDPEDAKPYLEAKLIEVPTKTAKLADIVTIQLKEIN